MPPHEEMTGRLTIFHEGGIGKEASSCYCRLHQCKPPPLRMHLAPDKKLLMTWYMRGYNELPRGRAHASAHVQMWKDMLLSGRGS